MTLTKAESMVQPATEHSERAFSFGRNWHSFINRQFDESRVDVSRACLLSFLKLDNLKGKTFLDVGCGSGLHSAAAWDAGAASVLSFDLDPWSVKATHLLHELRGNPENWSVMEGSALDPEFLDTLPPVDIVYAWGVLHHTGDMWKAIQNVAKLVKTGGTFYLGIYETTPLSSYWTDVKIRYNNASWIKKRQMEMAYIWNFERGRMRFRWHPTKCARNLIVGAYELAVKIRTFKKKRGMSWYTDIRDWLGGLPYEHATPKQINDFCEHELRMRMDLVNERGAVVEYRIVNDLR